MNPLFIFFTWFLFACTILRGNPRKIILEIESDVNLLDAKYTVITQPLDKNDFFYLFSPTKHQFVKKGNNIYSLTFVTDEPLVITEYSNFPFTHGIPNISCLLIPGDSIHLTWLRGNFFASGKGAEVFSLIQDLTTIRAVENLDSLVHKKYNKINTTEEFLRFFNEYHEFYLRIKKIIDRQKGKLSPPSSIFLAATFQGKLYSDMSSKMMQLALENGSTVSGKALCSLFDDIEHQIESTFPVDTLNITTGALNLDDYIQTAYLRSKGFPKQQKSHKWSKFSGELYRFAKHFYKGSVQRKYLTHVIAYRIIQESELGNEEYELINDFLKLKIDTIYKSYVNLALQRKTGTNAKEPSVESYNDGPYIFHKKNGLIVKHIRVVDKKPFVISTTTKHKSPILKIPSAISRDSIVFGLKKLIKLEETEYTHSRKMFVISDVEGNYQRFIELLQANSVIDKHFNWTFGTGHLVLVGDFVDRGVEVTELLWCIYALEDKAIVKGGKVHFVLGNHEIMNLSGETSYVHKKYKYNASLLKKEYSKDLYGKNSELGRWLRSKNIVEKIGNVLFVHGGISSSVNDLDVTLIDINLSASFHYSNIKIDSNNNVLNTLMSTKVGPLWYRGYYRGKVKANESQIDSTLKKFNVRRIITGHTIVGDTISVHYNSKVINTDTRHADGKSEALLIEGTKYYRVNDKGQRVLLFIDKKNDP